MKTTRRLFIGRMSACSLVAAGGGCASMFTTGPRRVAASERVNLALIGCGTQAHYEIKEMLGDSRTRVTVVCDPVGEGPKFGFKAERTGGRLVFKKIVDDFYGNKDCRAVADWREVIADPTVDAVMIETPDHWHVLMSLAAMRAGKHVYCQKPLTLGVEEGILLTKVAKETGVTFQVGNQGRSRDCKREACEIIRNGYLGECKFATVATPGGFAKFFGHDCNVTHQKFPDAFGSRNLWDLWQGPAEHWEDDAFIPGIHEPMVWRFNRRYGSGMICDFGAHEVDTLQWALGMERSGPVRFENMSFGDYQPDSLRPYFNFPGEYSYDIVYANGFRGRILSIREGYPRGLVFHAEKGLLKQIGSNLEKPECLKNWKESDIRDNEIKLYKPENGHHHWSDFIDGIYANRQVNSECEIGHRTITICHIANIAQKLGLKTLDWDPKTEHFVGANAEAANKLLSVPYNNGWKLA